jgi:hypothetical protein
MKPLSEVLGELAARTKNIEDSATALRDKNRAALQKRRDELDSNIDAGLTSFEAGVTDKKDAAQNWWRELKATSEEKVAALKSQVQERKAERSAERADEDAQAAAALAGYYLEVAEWAAVQAALAQAEADEAAGAS